MYDEQLAGRVRTALADQADVREIRMFGGLAVMVAGHMAVGIIGDSLMLRLGEEGADAALELPHVGPMDFTGRPMSTMVLIAPEGVPDDVSLARWVGLAVAHVASFPPR